MKQGIVEHLEAQNAQIVFRGADAELLPVKNEGRIYDPPKNHFGKSWTSNKALAVAQVVKNIWKRPYSKVIIHSGIVELHRLP